MTSRKISVEKLSSMARRNEKIVMVTAYDHPSAKMAEEAGVDVILVGDSVAMAVLGYDSTVPVSLEEMLVFMSAVSRGATVPLLVGDLPFGSYLKPGDAVKSSARVIKQGGLDAVKLEGGANVARIVHAIVTAGIPVMGHIGLTPQTSGAHGGFKVQGRGAQQARTLVDDAVALEEAGAFAVVLETIPVEVASVISDRLAIPTIGIGSGMRCDGQVLVWHDLLGISSGYGRHVKAFAQVDQVIIAALTSYAAEVRSSEFPSEQQSWHMAEDELNQFIGERLLAGSGLR
jgi:3-methyl-2-oxobutanoate hydroxymethyltransferase